MHSILALWATPRSTSTAFEWMMRQRGDYSLIWRRLIIGDLSASVMKSHTLISVVFFQAGRFV